MGSELVARCVVRRREGWRAARQKFPLARKACFLLRVYRKGEEGCFDSTKPPASLTVRRSFDGDAGAVQLTGGPLGRNAVRWNEDAVRGNGIAAEWNSQLFCNDSLSFRWLAPATRDRSPLAGDIETRSAATQTRRVGQRRVPLELKRDPTELTVVAAR